MLVLDVTWLDWPLISKQMFLYTSTMFVHHVEKTYAVIHAHNSIIDIKTLKHDEHVELKYSLHMLKPYPYLYICSRGSATQKMPWIKPIPWRLAPPRMNWHLGRKRCRVVLDHLQLPTRKAGSTGFSGIPESEDPLQIGKASLDISPR